MSGGGALGYGGTEAVPGWEYVDVLDGSGGQTHWRCRFCKKDWVSGGSRVMSHFLGKLCARQGGEGIGVCAGGGIFMQSEFKRAKEVLRRWQRTRNEEKQTKTELKDTKCTKKAVEALREGHYPSTSECKAVHRRQESQKIRQRPHARSRAPPVFLNPAGKGCAAKDCSPVVREGDKQAPASPAARASPLRASPKMSKRLIGQPIRKFFPRYGYFKGRVSSFDASSQQFTVEYEDGELEDLSLSKLEPHLLSHKLPRAVEEERARRKSVDACKQVSHPHRGSLQTLCRPLSIQHPSASSALRSRAPLECSHFLLMFCLELLTAVAD